MKNFEITSQIMEVGPIRFETYIGPFEYEQNNKQVVDISLILTLEHPELARNKKNFYNWMPIHTWLMTKLTDEQFDTHSELILAIAEFVFKEPGVSDLTVTSTKPFLRFNVGDAGCRMTFSKSS